MEIMAAIKGVESLTRPCAVAIYSDSQYLVRGMNDGWAKRWKAEGWRLASGDKAKNVDLWDRLLNLCSSHEVSFHWVRGHANDPLNERSHQLAEAAARARSSNEDTGYEPMAA
jgi:ribonuclease HI